MGETAISASETPNAAGSNKRRSTRVVYAIPIVVIGTDALSQPFRESTSTIVVDCYGCRFQSRNYVPKYSTLTVEIFHAPGWDRRVIRGRVVWVQRPRNHRENYQIAIEMEKPGNVWGITSAPADWFPHPDDLAQAPIEVFDPVADPSIAVQSARQDEARPWEPAQCQSEGDLISKAIPDTSERDCDAAIENSVAESDSDQAEEVTFTREHLDGQIRDAIDKTLRTISERTSEVVLREILDEVSERAVEAINQARSISEEAAGDLDAKLRNVLDETMRSLSIEPPRTC